jgi:arabinogalactan endo-1,4-beta-galactosidase
MKRKMMALVLTAALGVFSLAGCGAGSNAGNGASGDAQTEGVDSTSADGAGTAGADSADGSGAASGAVGVQTYFAELPTGEEVSDICVPKIENLRDDFICGVDISSLLAEEQSGVKYYDENGEEQDLLKILADSGVNYVRVRVWNDPFDADGNGYGGGNCNAETAAIIGARAAAYGMKLLVDFHYSDFWADPNKQMEPKAWGSYRAASGKAQGLYDFTTASLQQILDAGADVAMVQIGNEINNGLAGEKTDQGKLALLKEGAHAVRDIAAQYGREIKVAVHFTNVDDPEGLKKKAAWLSEGELDYDVFGISYYLYWHGTIDNMKKTLKEIGDTYGKETCIMETSWPWTGDDGDGFGNSISEDDATGDYRASIASQAVAVRDVCEAANEIGALGVFYWEPAWVPVGRNYDTNLPIWEENGSGWASSYSAAYDPDDAGKYYGGSSWDNQAFFDFDGHVLPSAKVWKYLRYGATSELTVDFLEDVTVITSVGEAPVMPEGVLAYMNDRSQNQILPVTWDEEQLANIDTTQAGEYSIRGVIGGDNSLTGTYAFCTVKVMYINLLTNPSFEENDMSVWNVTYSGSNNPTDVQTKASDAVTGEKAFHFWDTSDMEFDVEQTFTVTQDGTYGGSAYIQGGDVGAAAEIYLYIRIGDEIYRSDPVTVTGWVQWQHPVIEGVDVAAGTEITIGMHVKSAANGWGTIDDFELYKLPE